MENDRWWRRKPLSSEQVQQLLKVTSPQLGELIRKGFLGEVLQVNSFHRKKIFLIDPQSFMAYVTSRDLVKVMDSVEIEKINKDCEWDGIFIDDNSEFDTAGMGRTIRDKRERGHAGTRLL